MKMNEYAIEFQARKSSKYYIALHPYEIWKRILD